MRQSSGMDMTHLDASQLWASVLWGGIGGGYIIYGWRQKAGIPFAGGVAMSLACFFPALWMSLASIAIMFAVWWLGRQGY